MMLRLWMVVANQNKAKILEYNGRIHGMRLIEELHAAEAPPGSREHELAAKAFAKKVAAMLEKRREQGRFDDLALVAEPRFYGKLKHALHKDALDKVALVLQKDLVDLPDRDMKAHLRAVAEEYNPLLAQVAG